MSGFDTGASNTYDVSMGNHMGTFCGIGHGFPSNEYCDVVNAKTIINFGSNVFESAVCASACFFDAMEAGADYITLDPIFSTTAGKSSEWIQIKPATDGAVALAMVHNVIENEWYDPEYMTEHTSFPFLIEVETGYQAREKELDPTRSRGIPASAMYLIMQGLVSNGVMEPFPGMPEQGTENAYLVWDETSEQPVSYLQEGIQPALEGEFEYDGKKYITVFSQVKKHFAEKQYTSQWAEGISGVPADKINELTDKYIHNGPSIINIGWGGPSKYTNSDILGHAGALLVGMTGNIGKPGAGIGNYSGTMSSWGPGFATWPLPEELAAAPDTYDIMDAGQTDTDDVKMLVCQGDSLQQACADRNKLEQWLSKLDFFVMIDMYHTNGCKWADLVLPACTKFECDEEVGGLIIAKNHVQLREKVIDPLFESKTDFWIETSIGRALGYGDVLPSSMEEFVRYQLDNATSPMVAGMTLEQLQENQGLLPLIDAPVPRIGFADQHFSTPSGRYEVYYDQRVDYDFALPTYEDANEVFEGNPLREKYPLALFNARPSDFLEGQFFDSSWIAEHREIVLELNGEDMASRGLVDGDTVEVFNDRGAFTCKVITNEAIMPTMARIPQGVWPDNLIEGDLNYVTNGYKQPRMYAQGDGPVTPFNDTVVEVRKVGE